MMISVLIATSDRPQTVNSCLQSFQKSSMQHFEIILIDQSTNNKTKNVVTALHDSRVKYIHVNYKNKSLALNRAMTIAHGDIFCFTDDDCIVHKDWLFQITKNFSTNPTIDGIVGTTLPYKPTNHPMAFCVSTFHQKKYRIITAPVIHTSIGYGNNMAWRKTALSNLTFSSWLGPHSVGAAAEDADFILRQLMRGKKILCDPECKIYHNHWVNRKTKNIQDLIYIQGEMVCYTNFALLGWKFAGQVIKQNFLASWKELKKNAGTVLKRKNIQLDSWANAINTLLIRIKGLCIGVALYVKNEIQY